MSRVPFVPLVLLAVVCPAGAACDSPYATPGPYAVTVVDQAWTDASRERTLPVRIYVPGASAPGRRPAVVFSHGLGGSRAGGETWGRHWASHGFVSIHVQHPGSDELLWRDRGGTTVKDALMKGMTARAYVDRVLDIRFVVDEIGRRAAAQDPLAARIDVGRLAMSGHSFGARTTQAMMGERLPVPGVGDRYADPRFVAAIAFSPSPSGPASRRAARFAGMTRPFLSVTGTRDADPMGSGMDPLQRTELFANMPPGDKYLLVLDGADHLVFDGGRTTSGDTDVERCARMVTLAFLETYLEGNAQARALLAAPPLAGAGTWQRK